MNGTFEVTLNHSGVTFGTRMLVLVPRYVTSAAAGQLRSPAAS